MLAEICNILELTTIIICNFLVKKYVFLEPELEVKKAAYLLSADRSSDRSQLHNLGQ
jgi:hypothetical protein